ncbi:MAG: NifU family protein [Bacteroidales bacterium]
MDKEKRTDFEKKINDAIEMVRPYLVADGGNIEFVELTEDMIVKVQLMGACGSCPFSLQTLKNGVEQAVRKQVPEVKEVVSVN